MPKDFRTISISLEAYENLGEIVKKIRETTGYKVTKAGVIESLAMQETRRMEKRRKKE